MIHAVNDTSQTEKNVKAVGLISGGLDSTLAAQIIKDLGIDVYGVYFSMPWGCCDKEKANAVAQRLGIKFIVLQLDERYLDMVKKPKYGYGSALNPCVDCRIHMFSRAAQYMRHIGGDFVFTGEVLGQRPMSQMRHSMKKIEIGAGLEGRLLRPLCAQLLDPTIPEMEGVVPRDQLLQMRGRSRRPQMELAESYKITEYNQPAGGCLLTNHDFAKRMRDTLDHGYRNFRETIALKWGRHFRINDQFKAIAGRDEEENSTLQHYAHPDDTILEFPDRHGPTVVLKGDDPPHEVLAIAAGLIQHFSKYRDQPPRTVHYWPVSDRNRVQSIDPAKLDPAYVQQIYI